MELMWNDVDYVSQCACCEYHAEPQKSKTRLARCKRNSRTRTSEHTRITGRCLLMMADTLIFLSVQFVVRWRSCKFAIPSFPPKS